MHIEQIPLGSKRLKLFADVPWHLHRQDPCWVPPLYGDLLGNRLFGLVGILTPQHPYHKNAEVTHFIAWEDGEPVGRVSAAINHRFNRHYGKKLGFFGFWEVVDDYPIASALLDQACNWVKDQGMELIRGPGEYSNATHERQGTLIDGFQYPPTVELTHNPPHYAGFLERYGFCKSKDYHAYLMDVQSPPPPRLKRLASKVRNRRDVHIRCLELKKLEDEVRLIVQIYNDSWSTNWGFLPITDDEAILLANSLRLIVDPGLVCFAYVKGEPAAVLGAFPDPNVVLRPNGHWFDRFDLVRIARLLAKRRQIKLTRLMFFGVKPAYRNMGIDALLYEKVKDYAIRQGYKQCEASLLLEDNHLILRPSEFMGASRYKTWRIYDLPL